MFRPQHAALKWIAWLSVSFFYAYQYIIRVLPSVIMPDLMSKFQMDAGIFGQFSGVYYIGYGLAHIPLGVLLDRIGPRLIVPLCCFMCVLGLFPLVIETVWVYPVIGRFFIGIGSSGAILGVFKIVRMVFPQKNFSQILGISVTIGLVGAIYGSKPLHYFICLYGWEVCVMVLMVCGVVVSFLIFLTMPKLSSSEKIKSSMLQDTIKLLSNKYVIIISVCAGLMVGPLEGFADIWGMEFLMQAYVLTKSDAAFYPSLIFIGMGVGAPFLGAFSEKYRAYFTVISLSGAVMLLLFIVLLFFVLPLFMLPILLFVVGIFCAYQIPAIAKATLFVPVQLMGLTTAFANMVIMFFGYLYHGIIGFLIRTNHSMNDLEETKIYGYEDFIVGLSTIPVGLFLGIIGFVFLAMHTRQR
jgi:sugar phosphate permease